MTENDSKDTIFYKYFTFISGKRNLIFTLYLSLFVLLAYSSTGIKLTENIMDILPASDPVIKKHREILKVFNRLDLTFIDIGSQDKSAPISQDKLIKAANKVAFHLKASNLIEEVRYKWDKNEISDTIDYLRKYRASFFTEEDSISASKKLEPKSISASIKNWIMILSESPTPMLARAFNRDPLSLDALLLDKLKELKARNESIRIKDGIIFSQDMKHILILAKPEYSGTDSQRAAEFVSFMDELIENVKNELDLKDLHIAYLGSHRFSLDNSTMIKGDIRRTISISVISILVLSLLVYRRPLLSVLTLLPALFGAFFASGVIRLISPDISAISIGCGSMLIGIAVDYGIHILYHIDHSQDTNPPHRESILYILSKLIQPLILGAFTTITAFLTLQTSLIPGLKQLGLFAALGIGGAFIFSISALPLLVPERKKEFKKEPLLPIAKLYAPFFTWASKSRRLLSVITLLISFLSIFGLFQLQFEGDVQKLNAYSRETKRDWDIVRDSFGATMSSTSVAISAETLEEALDHNDALYDEIQKLQKAGLLAGNDSISNILPGARKGADNRKRWKEFWSEARLERLEKDLSIVSAEFRIRPGAFKDLRQSLPGEMPTFIADEGRKGRLKSMVSNQIAVGEDRSFVITNLKLVDIESYPLITKAITGKIPGANITNSRFFVSHMIELIYNDLKRLGGFALILVTALLALYKRDISKVAMLLLPLLISLLWTFGAMGLLGIRMNIINSIVVIFIFGLIIDYCIFLQAAWQKSSAEDDPHLSHTCGAISISALTTICGLGSLLFAKHPALHSIGSTAFLGICSGLVAVLLTVPLIKKSGDMA
ncbi:MAG: MMPL family transporter [bacterium]|nr:MMPL family transporter [bacterium]